MSQDISKLVLENAMYEEDLKMSVVLNIPLGFRIDTQMLHSKLMVWSEVEFRNAHLPKRRPEMVIFILTDRI